MKQQQRINGFTLIEILITVLILSIGLLGLAGLQVSSMKSNHSSYLRSQATIMAYDIIDRMRANPMAVQATITDYVANSSYTVTKSSTPYTVSAPAVTSACTTTTGCTPAQMANTDINQWRVELATQLPGGVGIICQNKDNDPDTGTGPAAHGCDNTGPQYLIKIWWTDDRTGTPKRFVTSYVP